MRLNGDLDMLKLSLIKPRLHVSASAPVSPTQGQVYYNSTDNKLYLWNGSAWQVESVSTTTGYQKTGMVIAYTSEIAPTGYLECNGVAINRTTYGLLFAEIGTMYGVGNGSTTFNIPDYRGEFHRGTAVGSTADPDRASRTNRGDGTTGDNVGTKQGHQLTYHNHTAYRPYTVSHPANIAGPANNWWNELPALTRGLAYSGGNETRPYNVNVMFCIRYL